MHLRTQLKKGRKGYSPRVLVEVSGVLHKSVGSDCYDSKCAILGACPKELQLKAHSSSRAGGAKANIGAGNLGCGGIELSGLRATRVTRHWLAGESCCFSRSGRCLVVVGTILQHWQGATVLCVPGEGHVANAMSLDSDELQDRYL